jgi:hypothetical protein
MTYPIQKIINSFLNNPNGILSKSFTEILVDLYGESLARMTFIHSLRRFVNSRCIHQIAHKDAGLCGVHPYAVLGVDGARRVSSNFFEYAACFTEFSMAEPMRDIAGAPLIDGPILTTGVAYTYPSTQRRQEVFEYREALIAIKEKISLEAADSALISFRKVDLRYYDKTYDLVVKGDYTEPSALISALTADPVLAPDTWRNWL